MVVTSPQGKALIIKDSVDETLKKILLRTYDQSELDKKFQDLATLRKDKDAAEDELNNILAEYQIFANCEFSNWVGRLKEAGIDIKTTLNS